MVVWCPVFAFGLQSICWELFSEHYLPKVLKLAGIAQKGFTRIAASQIIHAASLLAAENNSFKGKLLNAYFELCQDAIPSIRKSTLTNLKSLFQKVEPSEVENIFFCEVLCYIQLCN